MQQILLALSLFETCLPGVTVAVFIKSSPRWRVNEDLPSENSSFQESHSNYINSNNSNAQSACTVHTLCVKLFFLPSNWAEHTQWLVRLKFSLLISSIHFSLNASSFGKIKLTSAFLLELLKLSSAF